MIRRINKNNDLKDLIKSCPTGVIDDIYEIRYYIYGYNTEITASFEKKGEMLEVILPTSALQTLPNGVLYRKAFYKVVDSSYPDGYYNLMFEDNLNIWLDDGAETSPVDGYVTESQLSSTLSSYATQEWVSSQEFATETWVENKSYITSEALNGYATESWVSSQGYLTSLNGVSYSTTGPGAININAFESTIFIGGQYSYGGESRVEGLLIGYGGPEMDIAYYLDGEIHQLLYNSDGFEYATENWVLSQGYLTSESLSGYATESWVSNQGYLTSVPDTYASQQWVSTNFLSSTALSGYATESWVSSQGYLTAVPDTFATKEWVSDQSYITSTTLEGYATESWVQSQGYLTSETIPSNIATESWVQSQGYLTSVPDTFASQAWVSTNFLSSTALEGYATQSWVSSNFLSSTALEGYATQSWVSDQGYLTTENLSDYLLKNNVSGQIKMSFIPSLATIKLNSDYTTFINPGSLIVTSTIGTSVKGARVETTQVGVYSGSYNYAYFSYISDPKIVIKNYASTLDIDTDNITTSTRTISINDIATQTWVSSQGYLTSIPDTYATQQWVSTNFLSSTALEGYATQSWVSSNYLSLSSIWIGSLTAWLLLSPQEQAFYTIALITE